MVSKKIRVLLAALSLVACFAALSRADETASGYVNYIWMDPNGNGAFSVQFSNVNLNGTVFLAPFDVTVPANASTNKSVLGMCLSAQASGTLMCFSYASKLQHGTGNQMEYYTSGLSAILFR